ncbi:TPA: DUF2905 domain-containing protein [bacterium]|nr:DUF2905 domain-containing protein [bacterium]
MNILLAKALIIGGIILIILGGIVMFSGRIPWLGKLPGDIHIKKDGFSFYFPLTTCIIISIILTIIFRFIKR